MSKVSFPKKYIIILAVSLLWIRISHIIIILKNRVAGLRRSELSARRGGGGGGGAQ